MAASATIIGPTYIANGRTTRVSATSAGPNSTSRPRTVTYTAGRCGSLRRRARTSRTSSTA